MKYLLFVLSFLFAVNLSAKEVKIIIPYSAGGPTDKVTRTVIKYLNSERYKFIPEYKLGAGGSIAANYVASVKDETVLMITSNALVTSPLLTSTTNYNLEKDFILVEYLGTEPLFLVVRSNDVIQNYKDFKQLGKNDFLPYGSAGVGTSGHIASVIVSNNDKNYIHVPYKGSLGIIVDLLNGQLRWILDSEMNIGSFLQDGKIKPIGVYSNKRLQNYPNLPTIKELGVDDRNFYRWHIVVANKEADEEILKHVKNRLLDPSLQVELSKLGLNLDKPKSQNFFLDESVKVRRILRDFNPR